MKIFAVFVGGRTATSHIEVHDMRFVIAETIEETYVQLRQEWWGTPQSLHIDCWAEVTHADGYAITLVPKTTERALNLYFVNLGGYDGQEFGEAHRNIFIVAENEQKAKVKALKTIREWNTFHRDVLVDVEATVCLSDAAGAHGLFIHLEKVDDESQPDIICNYRTIGKNAAA